uniref:Cytochrom_C_asm domain-containing protein n=1 Tax=Steinernema glaseri TaxID=37863 RepID=A0A1I7Y4D3_9BILA
MSASIVFHLLAALAYIVLSISLWRPLTRGSTRTVLNAPSRVALLCAIIVHGAGLLLTIVLPQGLHLSWALALSAAIWLGMVVFWFQSLYLRLDSLLLILLPAATIVSLLAMAFPNGHIVNHVGNEWLRIHLMIALVAYGLSTVAALHAVLMTALDRQLHRPILHQEQRGLFSRVLDTMPPLLVQEELLFRLIRVSFVILTFTILSGAAVSMAIDEAQYRELSRLSRALRMRHNLTAVRGHEHIAPGRKTDPGPFFDWERVKREHGWPKETLPEQELEPKRRAAPDQDR